MRIRRCREEVRKHQVHLRLAQAMEIYKKSIRHNSIESALDTMDQEREQMRAVRLNPNHCVDG